MNVSLTPALEEMIQKKAAGGAYATASEVVREALRRLQAEERQLERLRYELQLGIDQIDRGETIEYTPDFMQQLIQESTSRMLAGLPVKDAVKP